MVEVQPEVLEECVKATCILHNFLRSSYNDAAGGGGQLEGPLHGLGHLATNMSFREANDVRNTFMAFFTAELMLP